MNEIAARDEQATSKLLDGLVWLGQMIERHMDEAVQPLGLSVAKLEVLCVLVQKGEPIPLGVLSRELHCVKSNITQLVDRLEADKLVRRMPDPNDRRSVLAVITEEGSERCDEGWQALNKAKQGILNGLPADDRKQLVSLLEHLYEDQGHEFVSP